jgi:hypothetical protein
VIDSAKDLRVAFERCVRCTNASAAAEYLPKDVQGDYDRRIRNAFAVTSYAETEAELTKIFRQLERHCSFDFKIGAKMHATFDLRWILPVWSRLPPASALFEANLKQRRKFSAILGTIVVS